MLTILIADDHPLFREAMRTALSNLAKLDQMVFIEAASAGEAKRQIAGQQDLDLLLLGPP